MSADRQISQLKADVFTSRVSTAAAAVLTSSPNAGKAKKKRSASVTAGVARMMLTYTATIGDSSGKRRHRTSARIRPSGTPSAMAVADTQAVTRVPSSKATNCDVTVQARAAEV